MNLFYPHGIRVGSVKPAYGFVEFVPVSMGTSADICGAPGSNGCRGRIMASTVGPQLSSPYTVRREDLCAGIFFMASAAAPDRRSTGMVCSWFSCDLDRPSSATTNPANRPELRREHFRKGPLCTIARWNKPLAAGIAISARTLPPPPDTKNSYVAGVAAKSRNVIAHPLQDRDNIKHPNIGGAGILFSRQVSEVEIAVHVQTMIVRHYDSIMITGETFAIVGKQIVPAAGGKPPPCM